MQGSTYQLTCIIIYFDLPAQGSCSISKVIAFRGVSVARPWQENDTSRDRLYTRTTVGVITFFLPQSCLIGSAPASQWLPIAMIMPLGNFGFLFFYFLLAHKIVGRVARKNFFAVSCFRWDMWSSRCEEVVTQQNKTAAPSVPLVTAYVRRHVEERRKKTDGRGAPCFLSRGRGCLTRSTNSPTRKADYGGKPKTSAYHTRCTINPMD